MIRRSIHIIYVLVGKTLNGLRLCYWCMRDFINRPKEKAVLFVAHPDDDTLFFHTFIKEYKPYVVLLTSAWSFWRYPCFKKAMKYYGVRYRAYALDTDDSKTKLLEKRISNVIKLVNPQICATHNVQGEYGHEMHKRVHNCVKKMVECKLLTPVSDKNIEKYPLSSDEIDEKTMIFNSFYTTETFVLDEYNKWVVNEKLSEEY